MLTIGNHDVIFREHNHHRRTKRTPYPDPTDPKLKHREIPKSVLEDLLLDAETALPEKECLLNNLVELLKQAEDELVSKRGNVPLSEYKEHCGIYA
ncbi:unnamed protein product [Orchesella dallaii]|uniref:Uncharacterized protein n=1 Tax=Orchesella dallaii TaxID=48710 RepID=A0ABP1QS55_9HEXA